MPKMIRCPSCATQMDVGAIPTGTYISCPTCQVKVRVPDIKTASMPAVGARVPIPPPGGGVPAPAPDTRSGRPGTRLGRPGTRLRKPGTRLGRPGTRLGRRGGLQGEEGEEGMEPVEEKKSNTGLIVGIVVVVLVVGIIIAIVATSKKRTPFVAKRPEVTEPVRVTVAPVQPTVPPPTTPAPEDPPPRPKRGALDPTKIDTDRFDRWISSLKPQSYGTGFWRFGPDPNDPEFTGDPASNRAWEAIQKMGEAAYPYLLAFGYHPDQRRRAHALVCAWTLSGKQGFWPKNLKECMECVEKLKPILNVTDEALAKAREQLGLTGTPSTE